MVNVLIGFCGFKFLFAKYFGIKVVLDKNSEDMQSILHFVYIHLLIQSPVVRGATSGKSPRPPSPQKILPTMSGEPQAPTEAIKSPSPSSLSRLFPRRTCPEDLPGRHPGSIQKKCNPTDP